MAYASTIDDSELVAVSVEEIGLEDVAGDPRMRVHELRSTDGEAGTVWAAVVALEPCSFTYHFAGDETVHVLEGEATVVVDGEQQVQLTPGTIASFVRGTSSRWHVHSPFREFAVLTGP